MDKFDMELSNNQSKTALLSPEIIEIRDKIVNKLEGESLKDIRSKIIDFLANEKNEETRLAALAARIVLLRKFISELSENQALLSEEEIEEVNNESFDYDEDLEDDYDGEGLEDDSQWKRLRIIEDCEVNGVRFPAGIQIDVKLIDAERLLEAGQAEIIEKPVDPEEETVETEEAEPEESEEVEETEPEETEEAETEESEESEETKDNEGEDDEGEDDEEKSEEDDNPSDSGEDNDVSEDDEDS